jgi:hypothetical protein
VDVAAVCEAFALGVPAGPPLYVARGELGRVSRLTTTTGAWPIKEIELCVPTVDEADTNVELQQLMVDAGVHLPRPRLTVDGHGLFGNVRVYEWLDITPVVVGWDMVSASPAPRTRMVTERAYLARWTAAWPAEFRRRQRRRPGPSWRAPLTPSRRRRRRTR